MPSLTRSAGSIRRCSYDLHGRAHVAVIGRLDAAVGHHLASLCAHIAGQRPDGLTVDLAGVNSATADGVSAMSRCLAVGRRLPGGIEIAVSSSAGRGLLVATLAGA